MLSDSRLPGKCVLLSSCKYNFHRSARSFWYENCCRVCVITREAADWMLSQLAIREFARNKLAETGWSQCQLKSTNEIMRESRREFHFDTKRNKLCARVKYRIFMFSKSMKHLRFFHTHEKSSPLFNCECDTSFAHTKWIMTKETRRRTSESYGVEKINIRVHYYAPEKEKMIQIIL